MVGKIFLDIHQKPILQKLKLFKNIQIHIIQVYSDTYYSSLSCIHK